MFIRSPPKAGSRPSSQKIIPRRAGRHGRENPGTTDFPKTLTKNALVSTVGATLAGTRRSRPDGDAGHRIRPAGPSKRRHHGSDATFRLRTSSGPEGSLCATTISFPARREARRRRRGATTARWVDAADRADQQRRGHAGASVKTRNVPPAAPCPTISSAPATVDTTSPTTARCERDRAHGERLKLQEWMAAAAVEDPHEAVAARAIIAHRDLVGRNGREEVSCGQMVRRRLRRVGKARKLRRTTTFPARTPCTCTRPLAPPLMISRPAWRASPKTSPNVT